MFQKILFFFAGFFLAVFPARCDQLDISAKKLIRRYRGSVSEFRGEVKFSGSLFDGSSDFLKYDRKKKTVFASGSVFIVIKSTSPSRKIKISSSEIYYDEKTDKVSSPKPSRFFVSVSTPPGEYRIRCLSFEGKPSEKNFELKGKPVIIKGNEIEGKGNRIDYKGGFIKLSGQGSLFRRDENSYRVRADSITIDTSGDIVNFSGNVRGKVYFANAGD
ncbi:MAG: hypothetical protein J7L54_07225 [Elusimicrobia bacterium]|nr:hypothetical protein [Elusimicrobiota bacterium]